MTRFEREKLAELLERIAAALDSSGAQAVRLAKAEAHDETRYAYALGALEQMAKNNAGEIRSVVRAFIAPPATDSRRRRRPQRGTAIPRIA